MLPPSKTKRPEVVDSDDEKIDSQQKKRRRIKKPQLDSSDDEGRKEMRGEGSRHAWQIWISPDEALCDPKWRKTKK